MVSSVRAAAPADAGPIARIYNHYVLETAVTFEEEPVADGEIQRRIEEAAEAALPFLVAEENGSLAGFASASKWKGRCAYRHSAESGIYLDAARTGRGIGRVLYGALLQALREARVHAVIAGIALPNPASVTLHERLGFSKVAHFPEVGRKFGKWIDVGYWQLLL